MQRIERWQPEAVPIGSQHKVLTEQLRRRVVRRIPLLLDDDVFDGDQTQLTIPHWLVDERLRLVGIDLPSLDQIAIGVVDAHSADTWIIDTRNPGGICEQRISVSLRGGQ